ncbi:hypothetical protein [Pseudomonas sp. EMN2]|uniref:hypothetical protein n=1 Tax=Pseudomonas sp. EMN2 TaxID=2615212 RepID=UPI00129A1588|nr:hypothetical protein [Pseudomonas sp. EMN2]
MKQLDWMMVLAPDPIVFLQLRFDWQLVAVMEREEQPQQPARVTEYRPHQAAFD